MNAYHPYTVFPLGDSALTINWGDGIDPLLNKKVIRLFQQVREKNIPYITDLVPSYSSLTVYYDLSLVHPFERTAFETVADLIEDIAGEAPHKKEEETRRIEIPVCYETKYAPDIFEIASRKNLTPEEVIAIHTSKAYRIYMLGFLPGFAYMGEIDEAISIPRKTEPRINVDAGSVGIAGRQTGIYPLASPGGWQIIGRTPVQLFKKNSEHPILFQPGDEVQFYSITEDEFKNYQKRHT